MNILVVEDEEMTCAMLKFLLEQRGFSVSAAPSAESARRLLEHRQFHLIILDNVLVGEESGLDLCRTLREEGSDIPIIFVSAKGEVGDKVAALRAGADDYISKPYDPDELLERVKAVVRRYSHEMEEGPVEAGGLQLNMQELKVKTSEGKEASLTPTEMRLLRHLLLNHGHTVSREALTNSIWGFDYEGNSNPVDVYVRRLRKKIEKEPSRPALLQTVRGSGYKLMA